MECVEKLGMSVEKIQHLREGPCGIEWYSNLTREHQGQHQSHERKCSSAVNSTSPPAH